MLEGSEREHSRAAERSLIIECTIAIEPSADFDSPKMPNLARGCVKSVLQDGQEKRIEGN